MFITERASTPEQNSYLSQYRRQRTVRLSKQSEKESKQHNCSLLSTNKDNSFSDDSRGFSDQLERYKRENTMLKQIVFALKLDMKSAVESTLSDQRNHLQNIVNQYSLFIEQLITDKKHLGLDNEELKTIIQEQSEKIKAQHEEITQMQKTIQEQTKEIQALKPAAESPSHSQLNEKQFAEYKRAMNEALELKDQCINQLNQILSETVFKNVP